MMDPAAHPDVSHGITVREETLALRLLWAIGAGYLLIELVLFSIHRAPRWDEAVYLSQVMPGAKAQFFAAFRARGITLLIAPVTWLGGSVAAVRLFLAVGAAIALTAAFWIWIPFVGVAAPVAALLFGFSWIGLLNGSEIYPNFWAATLGLAVAGLVSRQLAGGRNRPVVVASVLLAALALFRPTEATAVFGVLVVYLLVFQTGSWTLLVPLGGGLAIGWLPWVIEMSIRFGGPLTALREAGTAHFALAGVGGNVRRYLAYTDGRIAGPSAQHIPIAGVLWWGWLIALAVVAIAKKEAGARAAVLLCSIGGLVLATQYVIFVSALAARYLLPAVAFLSVPAAVGAVSLIRGGARERAVGGVALLLVLPWGIWQSSVADRVEAQEVSGSESFHVVGVTIRGLASGRPCTVTSTSGAAEIALASGCEGSQLPDPEPTTDLVRRLSTGLDPAFVVLRRAVRRHSPLGTMAHRWSVGPAGQRWFIYGFHT